MSRATRYWIVVVSKDHSMRGVAGNFIQACHGKQAPLKRMKVGDWVIVYSPKQSFGGSEPCQAFTAIGQVKDELIYQHQMMPWFIPFRRNVRYDQCKEVSILPLINQLEFIENKQRWGYQFRFGFFEIKQPDFNLLYAKMMPHAKK